MTDMNLDDTIYNNHQALASRLKVLYTQINKLAMKKPSESITPLIARKINHVIVRVKEQVGADEFLDAIETIPVEGQLNRYDEVLIVTAELVSAMSNQWASQEFAEFRRRGALGMDYEDLLAGLGVG